MPEAKHQLAAIMFTDIVGYTALMGEDEEKGFALLESNRQLQKPLIESYNGKWHKEMGDGVLASFSSVSDAVYCAAAIQQESKSKSGLNLRIGIHLGEVVFEKEDVFGDGVNIASRLEALAPEGEIYISEAVFNNIENKQGIHAQFVKEETLKNIRHPVRIYQLGSTTPTLPVMDTNKRSIAVMPFVNMSNDPEQEFFSEGISEEIINAIVQLPNLKVAGRTSSFSFKGKNEDLRLIGNKLGVANILEGSVRKFANKVRITVQMINASTGFHLWSKKYDRELDDVFQVQDEIALEIAKQLEITLSGEQSIPRSRQQTQNIDAYQLYYKGRSLFYRRGKSLFEGLKCFEKALEIDPDYALACSGLADSYIMLSFHGYLSPEESWGKAIPAAQKALKYGSDLGETHNTLAVIALLHDRKLEEAEKEFKRALELNPTHLQARVWYGHFYLTVTRQNFKGGIEQLKIATENDPLSSYAHACYSLTFTTKDKFDEAISSAKYAVELDSESWVARYALGNAYHWSGKLNKALDEYIVALEISGRHAWTLYLQVLTHLKMNQQEAALKIFKEMEARYRDHYLPPSCLAIAAAALGQNEKALELAHIAVDIVDPYLSYVVITYHESEILSAIPGFGQIIQRLGYEHLK